MFSRLVVQRLSGLGKGFGRGGGPAVSKQVFDNS